ncbi:uncharacterized protein LOC110860191 [Folsomia candida]|uniref:uncharacterized protein LOC110860191 n=1 Tax=Folsomia candida TaxID=158441 RepID=UPI000B90A1B4|nr:uncharacterized protein LOC110860191 [Folsomia candida]
MPKLRKQSQIQLKNLKKLKREDEDYRRCERVANSNARKKAREDIVDQSTNSERRRKAREDEESRKAEQSADSERRRKAREDEESRKAEQSADSERRRKAREDEENRKAEQSADSERRRKAREDKENRKAEQSADSERRRKAREDEESRKAEQSADSERRRKAREDEENRKAEQSADSERRRKAREDEENRKAEQSADSERRRKAREDKENRKAEQSADSERRRKAREDEENRKAEQSADSERRRKAREDEESRKAEQSADSERRRKAREDEENRKAEQSADSERRRKAREEEERRRKEQESDTERRRIARGNSIYNEFVKVIKEGPDHACASCDGLFFLSSMRPFLRSVLVQKHSFEFCVAVLRPGNEKGLLCSTCFRHINQGSVPKLNFSNGFSFPTIPEVLRPRSTKHPEGLTQLEERLVAARIPFMTITKLGVDRQCGLKGNVINVINPINETARILPRRFEDASVIQLMLMRKMEYNNPYLFESIRPKVVYDVAKYVATTELYLEENIVLSDDWLRDVEQHKVPENHHNESETDQMGDVLNPGGQQTLVMDFDSIENNEAIKFAPGENQKPISLLSDLNAEALSFPSIYCGEKRRIKNVGISRTDIAKSDARNRDRRCAIPSKLLYSFKLVQTHQIASQVQLCLRKKKGRGKPTAANLINEDFVENMVQHDDAYKVLRNVRSSPAYWQDKQKVLMSMIRQLGIPTMFITLSAAEVKWVELIVILKKVLDQEIITEDTAETMKWEEKADLIRRDPITCSRYFDYRLRQCSKYILLHSNGIFKEHPVVDSFTRIEFQHRGSPHMHGLFWLKNSPKYNEDSPESVTECEAFIDKYISCKVDVDGVIHQQHKHTRCCEVTFKGVKKCRFGMPYPPMARTRILLPFPAEYPESLRSVATKNLGAVKDQIQYLVGDKINLEFEEFMELLGLDEAQYIMAVRSSISRPTVFLKRKITEAFTNAYNPDLARLWKANMDIQFILDPYACCKYCAAYVSKSNRGMSELLNQVIQELKGGNVSCQDRLIRFSRVFLNGSEVSAQEAAYSVLSMPLSRCSRDSIYINTLLPEERVYITKSADELKKLPEDSTDVNVDGLLEHYCQRPRELNECTLAEFAALWTYSKKKPGKELVQVSGSDDEDHSAEVDEEDAKFYQLVNKSGYIRRRKKSRIIRFRNFGLVQDPENYYRENVMLYLPWRDEESNILTQDCRRLYDENQVDIERVKSEFDKRLDISNMENEIKQLNIEEDLPKLHIDDEFRILNNQDLEADFGLELGNVTVEKAQKIKMPKMLADDDYEKLITSLNEKQEKFHNHVIQNVRRGNPPFYEFVSGGAGVGKSMLINAITQTIMRDAVKVVGEDPSRLKVLLCASTGMAAFNISGVTLHQAFGLPFNQFDGTMPRLTESTRNKYASEFRDLDLIIIDEISMTSREHLFQIDERLRQIFKSPSDFGGKSILAVGDFHQLEPVMASWIFAEPNKGMGLLGSNYLWEKFRFFELTECMRQKDDKKFAEALNRLAVGMCNDEDIAMFRSREVELNGLAPPDGSIRLMYGNQDVETYNNKALSLLDSEGIISYANDRVQGRGKVEHHTAIREAAKKLPTKKAQNLPADINFKIGCKYMMTVNSDTSDGLVNGVIGTLKKIVYGRTTTGEKVPLKVWMDFPKEIGNKLKKVQKKKSQVSSDWVPVGKESRMIHRWPGRNLEVVRTQFAFVPAEAISIHKSQGSTFKFVVVSVHYSTKTGGMRKISRRALYVGFSRCPTLSGLFIAGKFEAPNAPGPDDPVIVEMSKLRKRPVIFDGEQDNFDDKDGNLMAGKSVEQKIVSKKEIQIDSDNDNESQDLSNLVLVQVGNLRFYRSDLLSISNRTGWLTDGAIDCFLEVLKMSIAIRRWESFHNFGAFLVQHVRSNDGWKRRNWEIEISSTLLIFPRCRNGHWTVMVGDKRTRIVTFYDSMNNFENSEDMMVVNVINFL